MELFQLKVHDEADVDQDNQDYDPVEGPPSPPPPLPEGPHTITVKKGASAPTLWTELFIKALNNAKSEEELNEWFKLNEPTLKVLNEKYPKLRAEITINTGKVLPFLRKASGKPPIPDDPNIMTGTEDGPPEPP